MRLTAEDHRELSELVIEAGWRIDHGQSDTVAELFVADGEMILGSTQLKGFEEIRAWGVHRLEASPPTRHICTNFRFRATGPGTADGTVYLTVYQQVEDNAVTTAPLAVGEYRDEYVRTSQGWRISRRYTEMSFVRPPSSTSKES